MPSVPGLLRTQFRTHADVDPGHAVHTHDLIVSVCRQHDIRVIAVEAIAPSPSEADLIVWSERGASGWGESRPARADVPNKPRIPTMTLEYAESTAPQVLRVAIRTARGSYSWPSRQDGVEIEDWLADLLSTLAANRAGDKSWYGTAERLLGQLDLLLAERDRLLNELTKVYDDLDVAEARIRQLEAARDQLREERYGVKAWTAPAMMVAIATFVATLLPTFLVLAVDDSDPTVTNNIQNTTVVARQVIEDCGAPVQVSPALPESE